MRIVGRIKDLIISAGGENIPPVIIEEEMKLHIPVVSNCLVCGDKKKFLAMLITLKTEPNTDPSKGLLSADVLAIGASIGSNAQTVVDVISDPLWKQYIDSGMQKANKNAISNAHRVQKWTILPNDFSEQDGLLTPTLKVKRNVVNKMYQNEINSMYI